MTEYIYDIYPIDEETWQGEPREPIVRCRDCAFMGHDKDGAYCTHFECWLCGEPSFTDVEPDGFCVWGERRGDAK